MQLKTVIGLVLVGLALTLVGFVGFDQGGVALTVLSCQNSNDAIKNQCITDRALASNDLSLCERATDENAVGFCITNIATAREDKSLCDTIQGNSYWFQNCYYAFAEIEQDVNNCAAITKTEQQQRCILLVADLTKDPFICVNVLDEKSKGKCVLDIATELVDLDICYEFFDGLNENICIKKIAQTLNDTDVCDLIASNTINEDCRERVARNLAKLNS